MTKRFLWIFRHDSVCEKCLGTGEFPPGRVRRTRDTRADDSYYNDLDRIATTTTLSSVVTREGNEPLSVADGGRSGGAGGGAAWDAGDGPVIADPFSSDATGAESFATADSMVEDAGSGSDTSDSSQSTSY